MTAINDILQVKACGEIFNQRVCNIFYYLVAIWTGNADLDDVIDVFELTVLDQLTDGQSNQFTWLETELLNVSNNSDFAVQATVYPGVISTSSPMPSYVAASIRLQRANRTVRQGGKRLAGITEDMVSDNNLVISPGIETTWTDALKANLQDATPAVEFRCDPVIVGRAPITGALEVTRFARVTDAFVSPLISTQGTRKQKLG